MSSREAPFHPLLALFIIAVACGARAPADGNDTALRGSATDPGGASFAHFTRDQIASGYPCDLPAKALEATPLRGPYPSVARFCEEAGMASCETSGPSVGLPAAEAAFSEAMVVSGERSSEQVAFIAVERAGDWYVSQPLGETGEVVSHPGPVFTEEVPGQGDRVVFSIEIACAGDAEVAGRTELIACSTGASGIPSCARAPESWTLRDSEDPIRLLSLPCDDGSVVVYGNPSRLPDPLEASARTSLGRWRPVFP